MGAPAAAGRLGAGPQADHLPPVLTRWQKSLPGGIFLVRRAGFLAPQPPLAFPRVSSTKWTVYAITGSAVSQDRRTVF